MNGAVQNRKGDLTRRVFLLLAGWLVAVAMVGALLHSAPTPFPGAGSSSGSHCTSTVPSSSPPFLGPCPGGEGRWQCLLALPPLTGYLGSFTERANTPLLAP